MSDNQPQQSHAEQPTPPQGKPFANPYDAPPPFPSAGSQPSSAGYSGYSAPGSYGQQYYAPLQGAGYGHQLRPSSADDKTWAILAHLSGVIAWVISAGWLNAIGPLIVWLIQKDKSPFVRNAAAGAFNFALTMWIVGVLGWILTITVIGAIVGIPMIILSAIGSIVLGIVGAVKTANGESYTYPWQLKVLS